MNDIDRIRELEAARTPGEWVRYVDSHGESWISVKQRLLTRRIAHICTDPTDYGKANGEYLAAICEAFPALLAAVDERDKRITELRGAVELAQWFAAERDWLAEYWIDVANKWGAEVELRDIRLAAVRELAETWRRIVPIDGSAEWASGMFHARATELFHALDGEVQMQQVTSTGYGNA